MTRYVYANALGAVLIPVGVVGGSVCAWQVSPAFFGVLSAGVAIRLGMRLASLAPDEVPR